MLSSAATVNAVRSMRALIVDDEPSIRSLVSRVITRVGGSCEMAGSAEEALERLAREPFDIALLDIVLPEMDGLALARTLAQHYSDIPLIMITGSAKFETAISAMQAGAVDYVVKPFDPDTLAGAFERAVSHRRIRLQAARAHGFQQTIAETTLEIRMLLGQPGESAETLVKGFIAALALRSADLASHVQRVAELSRQIGGVLQLSASDLDVIARTALLHDVGKLTLPAALLGRAEGLTEDEIAVVRRYPEFGYQVVTQIVGLGDCADAILAQLERYDGSGWPQGLRGTNIPLAARIIAVANTYDVMIHPRPHAAQRLQVEALQELGACSGTQFDPDVVRALHAAFDYQPASDDWEFDIDL